MRGGGSCLLRLLFLLLLFFQDSEQRERVPLRRQPPPVRGFYPTTETDRPLQGSELLPGAGFQHGRLLRALLAPPQSSVGERSVGTLIPVTSPMAHSSFQRHWLSGRRRGDGRLDVCVPVSSALLPLTAIF